MWYAEINFKELPADQRSLTVAFANLLQKFEYETNPLELNGLLTQDDPVIDWWSVAEYVDGMKLVEVREDGSWPDTGKAIIKYRRMSEEQAGPVDHYCLVADLSMQSVIDSLDGTIRRGDAYGQPLGWASYTKVDPVTVSDVIEPNIIEVEPVLGTMYTMRKGESIWQLARKLRIPAQDLIDHNDIDDPYNLPENMRLHLPFKPTAKEGKVIKYEVLDQPRLMHVSKSGGTTKQLFGNIRKWEDIKPTGINYPEETNVVISAIATVPVGEEVAAYYMEKLALGDYTTTGRVKHTIGFNHSHLSDGHVTLIKAPEPEPVEEVAPEPEAPESVMVEAEPEVPAPREAMIPPPIEPEPTDPNAFKATLEDICEDHLPVMYSMKEDYEVHDQGDENRPARLIHRRSEINIQSTFIKDGILYGRPSKTQYWFGIPMDILESTEELYNTDIPLPDRVLTKNSNIKLTERGFILFSKVAAKYNSKKTKEKKK